MNNPFNDPSVTKASGGTAKPMLDPSKINGPPKPTPVMATPGSFVVPNPPSDGLPPMETSLPGPYPQTAMPVKNHQNLMDEIGNSIKSTKGGTILKIMRWTNLILATFTIVAGILAWILGHVTTFQKIIAGIYIIVFGALLLAFELRTEQLDHLLRANFGFMYGNQTRTIFLLFMAIWPLSMGNFWVTILNAVLLFVNAFFNYFVISQHPAFTHANTPTVMYQQAASQPGSDMHV